MNTSPSANELTYDWDGKLQSGEAGGSVVLESTYTPDGIRIARKRTNSTNNFHHKYIVDPVGKLPNILLVLDADNSDAVIKTYIHANDQVVCQHDGDARSTNVYYYLYDRLGSVRAIIGYPFPFSVKNCYFYGPWGEVVGDDVHETITNPYGFAGYLYDSEIGQYHCNARQYDIALGRFASYDPVRGSFKEPMTLHRYLYCNDDPMNRVDRTGAFFSFMGSLSSMSIMQSNRGMRLAPTLQAGHWATHQVKYWSALGGGLLEGAMNVAFGPSDVDESTKFLIGFLSGAITGLLGFKLSAAAISVGSLVEDALNTAASEGQEFTNANIAKYFGKAVANAVVGGVLDYMVGEKILRLSNKVFIGIDLSAAESIAFGYKECFD